MLSGCNPTQAQQKFWDELAHRVGCVACRAGHGVFHPVYVSIHHISGRSKPWHHWYVLPLCAGHHQDGTGNPKLKGIAVHPWKARFESRYGDQESLWLKSLEYLVQEGGEVPEALKTELEAA